jgi:predicted flap endonuclease-1-like 5' DNA nuclease
MLARRIAQEDRMNGTDTAAGLMSDNGWLTTASLVVIAILVIVVILAIWWGSRLRARQRSERPEMPPAASERTIAPPPIEPPVTPAPPPLADATTGALVEPESAVPAAAPAAPAGDTAQPVTMLKGLGPKVAARLGELGVTTVGQIAALSPAEAEALDAELGSFSGRMARDRWIEQAKLLAAGDTTAYEATFGKLG